MDMIYIWAISFLLGIKHSLDADHLVAVSAIASRQKNPWQSALDGIFWGIGHTGVLLIVAVFVLVFEFAIPPNAERYFEFLVGLALIWLGVSVIRESVRLRFHVHSHKHEDKLHLHLHSHAESRAHDHGHGRSVFVGMIHGLAGSAALMLLVLTKIKTVLDGIVYVLIFGCGMILGMLIFGGVIGIPLAISADSPRLNASIRLLTGLGSLGLGLWSIAQTWPKPL